MAAVEATLTLKLTVEGLPEIKEIIVLMGVALIEGVADSWGCPRNREEALRLLMGDKKQTYGLTDAMLNTIADEYLRKNL